MVLKGKAVAYTKITESRLATGLLRCTYTQMRSQVQLHEAIWNC